MSDKHIELNMHHINDAELLALAQFLKRITWSDMRSCAIDDAETELIRTALHKIQDSLIDHGFNPR